MYAFVAPILPGKTETWLKYTQELKATRMDEFIKAMQKGGVRSAQARLQRTPTGDYSVVWFDGDSPTKFFNLFMNSDEPVIKWFREKVLIECEGVGPGIEPPTQNELVLNFNVQRETSTARPYDETLKR
ncbi:MAG TPA: hypothetical protein DCZ43_03710 [candidate division Zixibacteria bacterium]|nr:hypothetical protein [candidate division Zixibacteria bacterium]